MPSQSAPHIHFNTILSVPVFCFSRGSPTNILYAFLVSAIHATCPAHPSFRPSVLPVANHYVSCVSQFHYVMLSIHHLLYFSLIHHQIIIIIVALFMPSV